MHSNGRSPSCSAATIPWAVGAGSVPKLKRQSCLLAMFPLGIVRRIAGVPVGLDGLPKPRTGRRQVGRMEYTYSVAISFLSADLEVAREIRRALKARVSLPVFFYPDLQEVLAGGIYEEALSEPFEYQSRVSVWTVPPWMGQEWGHPR